jgi:predicted dehydrogenase
MVPRIAVIGAGRFGEMHLRAFSQMHRETRIELAGTCDVDRGLLAKRSAQYAVPGFADYRALLAEASLEAVSIATPDFLHREIALACLRAGKHVLVEKPLDTTTAGCRELIAAAGERNLLLQVDFHKRSDPYHRALRDLVRQGSLGEIAYGYAHIEDRIDVPRDWFPRWAAQSSPAWFWVCIYMT